MRSGQGRLWLGGSDDALPESRVDLPVHDEGAHRVVEGVSACHRYCTLCPAGWVKYVAMVRAKFVECLCDVD